MLSIHGDPTGIPVLMLAISCECFNLAIQKGSRPILYVAYIIALFAAIFLGVIINWNSV